MDINEIKNYLKSYDGSDMRIMEVCGSHTAAIAKCGIPGMLSDRIHLLSGPGCPVCVTPTSYIDRLIELSRDDRNVIATFGDLMRVPGSSTSLAEAKGEGASVEMVYSPMDILEKAAADRTRTYIFAAVGFETTTPVYALLAKKLEKENIDNVRLLTAIKTMPAVIEHLMENGAAIDGFLAPGHVSVVTGSDIFLPIAQRYSIPFGVSGFAGEELLIALYGIVRQRGQGTVKNYYPKVVTACGNTRARALIEEVFEPADASWRGLGSVAGSGMLLRDKYAKYDMGSAGLNEDDPRNRACRCGEVLMGQIKPHECPLYGKACTPIHPQGACMVSEEGSCHAYYVNNREL